MGKNETSVKTVTKGMQQQSLNGLTYLHMQLSDETFCRSPTQLPVKRAHNQNTNKLVTLHKL